MLSRARRHCQPNLVRRIERVDMLTKYVDNYENTERICDRSFDLLVRHITKTGQKMLASVDYVTGNLVNDISNCSRRFC